MPRKVPQVVESVAGRQALEAEVSQRCRRLAHRESRMVALLDEDHIQALAREDPGDERTSESRAHHGYVPHFTHG